MIESTAVGDLRAAFAVLAPKSEDLTTSDLTMLHGRVSAAVDEMKAAGILPERIVVAVKGLAGDTGVQWTNNKLFEQLVNWTVERYYAPASNE